MKTQLVVIQPTSFCNINCRYCYLPHRATSRRISAETLSRIFETLFTSPFVDDELLFLWHAGEPLTLPIRFYEQAFALQRQWNTRSVRISNAFQTNGVLLTDAWCQFIKTHDVHLGVSIDGPQQIHDANRVDKAGRGTFERVQRGLSLLRTHGIDYTVISVVTKDAIDHPDEFWQCFAELRPVRLGLNPEEVEGVNRRSSLETEEDIRRYRGFFKRLVELNEESEHPLSIREINASLNQVLFGRVHDHTTMNVPMTILSFDCDGNISTFAPELLTTTHPAYGNFVFGNVFEGTLEDMSVSAKLEEVNAEIQRGVAQCRTSCRYFDFCGGGSPSNKLHENGRFDSAETTACRLKIQVTTDVVLEHLEGKYYLNHVPVGTEEPA